jgi:hypothetical protein
MVETRSSPKIWRIAWVKVVFPDPLSPATPKVKISGEDEMTSLKFGAVNSDQLEIVDRPDPTT